MSFGNNLARTWLSGVTFAVVFGLLLFYGFQIQAASTCSAVTYDSATETLSLTCTDSTDTHSLSCTNANNPKTLSLTVNGLTETLTCPIIIPPNAIPTAVISGPTTGAYGANLTFTITGTDTDVADTLTYNVDWNGDSVADVVLGPTTSGTGLTVARSWTTAGPQTFRAQVVDSAGGASSWASHTVTISPPPAPTSNFYIQHNGGAWGTSNLPLVDANDTIALRWDSLNADSCTGTNFNTSGSISNTGMNVSTPNPGATTQFRLTCTGPGGSIDKTISVTAGLPNFTRPNATHNLSTTFDPVTGEYTSVTVSFNTSNNGQSGTVSTAQYSMRFDSRTPTTGTIGLLTRGATTPGTAQYTKTFTNIPFGNHIVTIVADSNGNQVPETNETDNTYDYDFGGTIPPPNPEISITADRIQLRNNETTTIRWDTVATYPTLVCAVNGPGMNLDPSGLQGNQVTQPITAKSEYTLRCTETITGVTWTDSVMVETQGVVEEI